MSMDARLVKRFWIGATVLIMAFTLFVVGRNVVHAIKIQRQINELNRQKAVFQTKITAVSITGCGGTTTMSTSSKNPVRGICSDCWPVGSGGRFS